MHSRLCVRCRCALCAGVRTGTTFPPPVAVPVPAWSSRRGQCVCPLLVFDCETLVPQLNRRRSLGPRRFSVLAGGLWNRNDVARAGHTPHTAPATAIQHRDCARTGLPGPPRTGPGSCHCHSLFLLRLCGSDRFFSRRGAAVRGGGSVAAGSPGRRLTAHRAAHAHRWHPQTRGRQGAVLWSNHARMCPETSRAPRPRTWTLIKGTPADPLSTIIVYALPGTPIV